MDVLHTCYQSHMRLYPEDPDRLTLGRWVWCPEGAEYLPFEHSFLSSKWDPFSWRVDPDIGEVRGLVGYSSGKITPRFTGRHFCGAVILYQEGSPLALMGTPAVDAEGVPLCCDAPPAVGGLALGGEGIVHTYLDIPLWLRPEELVGMAEGDPIFFWPRKPGTERDGTSDPFHEAVYHLDPVTGFGGAQFYREDVLGQVPSQVFWDPISMADWSVYVVLRTPVSANYGFLVEDNTSFAIALAVTDTEVAAVDGLGGGVDLFGESPDPGSLHVWGSKRRGDQWSVWRDGVLLGTATASADPMLWTDLVGSYGTAPTSYGWVPEIIIYPFALEGPGDVAVWDYLLDKYGRPEDVITGAIIAYAGAGVPTGYLACNGAAVSRTTYAALFAALGVTWGAGDGSTTFNLPDLRGRVGIGAGTGSGLSPRSLAALGGEENHQLNTNELAAHNHGANVYLDEVTDFAALSTMPFLSGMPTALQGINTTAPLDTAGAGGDTPHNNMQPFAVVQYLVKT